MAAGGAVAAAAPGTDLFTGSATQELPLDLPVGTGGMTPELALRYSSHARGDSWVGSGWSLGLPAVSRSLAKGTPSYDDAADVFELAGDELVPESPSPALPRRYRTRRDRFVRVVHEVGDTWTVLAKDGTALRFGLSPNARITRADGRVFQWLLEQQEDPHGNAFAVGYDRRDPGTAYLQSIRWTLRRPAAGAALASLDGDASRDRKLELMLEPRSDVAESRRAGFVARVAHRLDYADVKIGTTLVRRYDLRYVESPDTFRSLLASVATYGSDAAAASPRAPFVTSFAYHSNVASGTTGFELVPWSWPAGIALVDESRQDQGVRLADVDGDARPDLVKALALVSGSDAKTSTLTLSADSGVYRNDGSGFAGARDVVHALPSYPTPAGTIPFSLAWQQGAGFHTTGFDLVDLTGDGRADLVGGVRDLDPNTGERSLIGMPSWFAGSPDGFAARPDPGGVLAEDGWGLNRSGLIDLYLFSYTPGLTSGNTRFADLTGDGLPELLIRGVEFKGAAIGGPEPFAAHSEVCLQERLSHYYFENRGELFFERAPVVDEAGPRCQSSLHRVATDFQHCDVAVPFGWCAYQVLYNEAHPFLFHGDPFLGTFPWAWLTNLEFGAADVDLNGDGLADTIAATNDPLFYGAVSTAWLNDGARGYEPAPAWALPAGVYFYVLEQRHSRDTGVRLADVNGDGRVDLLEARPGTAPATWLNDGHAGGAPPTPWVPSAAWLLPGGLVFVDDQGRDTGVRLLDLDGDGMTDVVRSIGAARELWRNRGSLPDLLVAVTSPLGGRTSYEYGPSTRYDNGGADGEPDLPFAMPVVASVTVSPSPGQPDDLPSMSRFAYAGGSYDPAARDLRGFASVVETRPDGSRVERSFAQDDARSGAPLAERVLDAQGRPWLETRWSYLEDATPPYASLVSRIDRLEWDGAATPRTSRTELRYDGGGPITYGNVTAIIEYGEVDSASGADLIAADTRTSELVYVVNGATHLVDRVAASWLRAGATPGAGPVLRDTRFYYDGDWSGNAPPVRGDLTRRVDVLADPQRPDPTTTFEWDVYGNPVAVTTPRANAGQGGGTARTEYDARFHAFPVAVVNAAGHRSEWSYTTAPGCPVAHDPGEGLPGTERGPNDLSAGTSGSRCYDVFGRLTEATAPAGLAATTWSYGDAPLAGSVTEARRASAGGWRLATTRFDGLGRPVQSESTGPHGQTVVATQAWDELGRLVAASAPGFGAAGAITEHRYDVLGRAIETTLPGSGRVHAVRHDRGVVEAVDPLGHATRRIQDAFGRVVRVEEVGESETAVTHYGYDAAGALTSIQDHHGNTTSFTLDRLGRRRSVQDPDTGVTTFDWDAGGNLVAQTSGSESVTWVYDVLDRPFEQRAKSSQGLANAKVVWRWDTAQNGIGQLALRNDDLVHSQRIDAYDLLGRPTQTTHLRRRGSEKQLFTFATSYDRLGQVATRTHPTGTVVRWLRDPSGHLAAIQRDATFDASGIEWTADGRVASWVTQGGVAHERSYDPATRRLTSLRVDGGAGEPLVDRRYVYDRADRATQLIDAIDWSRSLLLGYDALGRLVESRRFEVGSWVTRSHMYDAIGNLVCRDAAGSGCAGGTTYWYPINTQLRASSHKPVVIGGQPVSFFAGGHTRQIGGRSFDYDALGRLTEVWQGGAQQLDVAYASSGRAYSVWSVEAGERAFTLEPDFEWGETTGDALIQVHLDGLRIATHRVPFAAPPTTPICAGAPLALGPPGSPLDLWALFAPGFAALALLRLRRTAPRVLVAVGTGTSFLIVVSVPTSLGGGGGAASAQVAAMGSLYHHGDHLGSVLLVTDETGNVVGEPSAYEPWGRPLDGDPPATPFGFHGNRRAAALYDYGARWYDPSIGRFLQPDPALADPYDPQALSPYSYVRNDPVNRIDPTGALSFSLNAQFYAGQVDQNGFTGVMVGLSWAGGSSLQLGASGVVGGVEVASYQFRQYVDDLNQISRVGAFRVLNSVSTHVSGAAFDRNATRYAGVLGPGQTRARTPDPRDQKILDGLHPFVANLAVEHLRILEILGIDVTMGDGFRSYDEQDRTYLRGRRGRPNERPVTNARGGESYHNFGIAYDVKAFDDDGRYIARGSHPSYRDAGEIGEALGLTWGGRWRNADPSHFQFDRGLPLELVRKRYESGKDPIYGF